MLKFFYTTHSLETTLSGMCLFHLRNSNHHHVGIILTIADFMNELYLVQNY